MRNKLTILLALAALMAGILACSGGAPAGVSNIYMANDADGANKMTTFAPTDQIYVFFDVNGVEEGTQFDIQWYALNVEGEDPNTPFLTSNYSYAGEDTLYGQIESTAGGFPAAQYKVEIYMDGTKVGEQPFTIQ